MIFAGCSTSPYGTNKKVVTESIPPHLLQQFCEWKSAGVTVKDLADGYVHNTLCGKKYETQVEEQREYLKRLRGGE